MRFTCDPQSNRIRQQWGLPWWSKICTTAVNNRTVFLVGVAWMEYDEVAVWELLDVVSLDALVWFSFGIDFDVDSGEPEDSDGLFSTWVGLSLASSWSWVWWRLWHFKHFLSDGQSFSRWPFLRQLKHIPKDRTLSMRWMTLKLFSCSHWKFLWASPQKSHSSLEPSLLLVKAARLFGMNFGLDLDCSLGFILKDGTRENAIWFAVSQFSKMLHCCLRNINIVSYCGSDPRTMVASHCLLVTGSNADASK